VGDVVPEGAAHARTDQDADGSGAGRDGRTGGGRRQAGGGGESVAGGEGRRASGPASRHRAALRPGAWVRGRIGLPPGGARGRGGALRGREGRSLDDGDCYPRRAPRRARRMGLGHGAGVRRRGPAGGAGAGHRLCRARLLRERAEGGGRVVEGPRRPGSTGEKTVELFRSPSRREVLEPGESEAELPRRLGQSAREERTRRPRRCGRSTPRRWPRSRRGCGAPSRPWAARRQESMQAGIQTAISVGGDGARRIAGPQGGVGVDDRARHDRGAHRRAHDEAGGRRRPRGGERGGRSERRSPRSTRRRRTSSRRARRRSTRRPRSSRRWSCARRRPT
jgi:hypothetical protein